MTWNVSVARMAAVFEGRVRRRTSMAKLSSALGHDKGFLSKLKDHCRGLRTGDVLNFLECAGDEMPEDAFHEAFGNTTFDPVRLLAANRRRQGLEPSAFLVAIASRILDLINVGSNNLGRWRSRIDQIRRYERLRFRRRELAQQKLEWLVNLGVALIERSSLRPTAALGDLALALSSLAAVYRTGGRLNDALDALLLAHPLAVLSNDPLIEGVWFQKAAYLLVYLNRCDRAYEFVAEASMRFIEAGEAHEQAKSLVDLGFVLSRSGHREAACKNLRRALRILDPVEREYMFAAHQILAGNLAILGKLPEAIVELEKATEFVDEAKLLLGLMHWSRAKLLVLQGPAAWGSAAEAFRLALQLHQSHGSPSDVADLAFEYAALLVRQRNRLELEKLAADLSAYFGNIDCDSEIREVIENFVALVSMKELKPASFKGLRERLPQGSQREGTIAEPQPPGGHSQPISTSSPIAALLFGGTMPSAPSSAG